MNELELTRMELDNHIGGLEISKASLYWSEDDERILQLMYRIKSILERVKVME